MDITKYYKREGELPLDDICSDGGFCAIFRRIACIGDSLSSGEFETVDPDGTVHYNDIYEHSWGQYIARMTGAVVYNFSRGGMTASEYLSAFADERGLWDPKYASDAYIIALGVNDLINQNKPIGDISDIDTEDHENNARPFIGDYARIIKRYKTISPDAKFFLVTIPDGPRGRERRIEASQMLTKLADAFTNTYVIDLFKYAPEYDSVFKENFFLRGHMNPQGYLLTAKMIASYIDYIIRSDPKAFSLVGLIGR